MKRKDILTYDMALMYDESGYDEFLSEYGSDQAIGIANFIPQIKNYAKSVFAIKYRRVSMPEYANVYIKNKFFYILNNETDGKIVRGFSLSDMYNLTVFILHKFYSKNYKKENIEGLCVVEFLENEDGQLDSLFSALKKVSENISDTISLIEDIKEFNIDDISLYLQERMVNSSLNMPFNLYHTINSCTHISQIPEALALYNSRMKNLIEGYNEYTFALYG